MHNPEVIRTAKKKVTFAPTVEEIDPIEFPPQFHNAPTIFSPNYNRLKFGLKNKEHIMDFDSKSLECRLLIFLLVLGAGLAAMHYMDDIKTIKPHNGL